MPQYIAAITDGEYRKAVEVIRERNPFPAICGRIYHRPFLVNPTRIVTEGGRVSELQCVQMELGEPGDSGRQRPIPIEDSGTFIEADTVIAAVGQAPDLSFLPANSTLERTPWETLVIDAIAAGR